MADPRHVFAVPLRNYHAGCGVDNSMCCLFNSPQAASQNLALPPPPDQHAARRDLFFDILALSLLRDRRHLR
eukprot:3110064-Rhodomonas_salina.1